MSPHQILQDDPADQLSAAAAVRCDRAAAVENVEYLDVHSERVEEQIAADHDRPPAWLLNPTAFERLKDISQFRE